MKRSRHLIAVFDDWDALADVLAGLDAGRLGRSGAVLHTRKDEPPPLTAPWLVQDMTELPFATHIACMRCTTGTLAAKLIARSTAGAHNLADALRGWVSCKQASELQWHIEKGRLVLWLRPAAPEDFEILCAQLVQASPHLVELCDMDFDQ